MIDGQTATIVFREADGHVEQLPQLAAELIAAKPTILVSAGPQPIAALKDATTTIPIVMAITPDPVTCGFVRFLARPGGNLTGLSMVNTELSGKRIELLREVAWRAARSERYRISAPGVDMRLPLAALLFEAIVLQPCLRFGLVRKAGGNHSVQ